MIHICERLNMTEKIQNEFANLTTDHLLSSIQYVKYRKKLHIGTYQLEVLQKYV